MGRVSAGYLEDRSVVLFLAATAIDGDIAMGKELRLAGSNTR